MRTLIAVAVLFIALHAGASEPSLGPAVEGYGPTYPIANRDVPLPEDFIYKAVFDAAVDRDEKALNTGLVSVARYLNMHARNGVPVENMNIAIVVHGPALKTLLTDEAYESRYGVANPNTELVAKLEAVGVVFYVCGQSMGFGGVDKDELVDAADVALSAMTMLTVLQSEGFALLQ